MKHFFLLLNVFVFISQAPQLSQKEQISQLVETIFGQESVDLSPVSRIFLEELFYNLSTASSYEQMVACKRAATTIIKEKLKTEAQEPQSIQTEQLVMILTIYQEHFERCARLLKQTMPDYCIVFGWLKNAFFTMYCWCASLIKITRITPIEHLTHQLINYTHLERTEILTDHQRTLSLLTRHNKHEVPLAIRFWDYPRYRHRLLESVKALQYGVIPQGAFEDAITLAGEQAAMEAAKQAAAVLGKEDEEITQEAQEELENVEDPSAIENFNTQASQFEETINTSFDSDTNTAGSFDSDTNADAGQAQFEKVEKEFKSLITEFEQLMPQTKTLLTSQSFGQAMQNIKTILANSAKGINQEGDTLATNLTANIDQISFLPSSVRTALKASDRYINPLKYAMHSLDKADIVGSKVTKEIGLFYNRTALKTVVDKVSTKLSDTGNAIGKKLGNEPLPDFDSNKEAALYYLKHPFRATGSGAKWFVTKGFNLATKLGPRNLYRMMAKEGNTFGNMMLQMIEQMEISMGSQLAISWESAAQADQFVGLVQQRNTLMSQLSNFFTTLQQQQQLTLTRINANYTAQSTLIAQQYSLQQGPDGIVVAGLLPNLFTQEHTFLTNSMINTTVKQIFLANPLQDDQFFTLSPMLLTDQPSFAHPPTALAHTWYNPHRVGNWEFCTVDYAGVTPEPVTSFVQYEAQPLTTSSVFKNGDPTVASRNCVFTDYIPPLPCTPTGSQTPYTITIEVTLLSQPLTPCMLGIVFNGARWVSGVFDFHNQQRLFCLYAGPEQKGYNVGFAETFYMTPQLFDITQDQLSDTGVPGGINAISPVFQILSPASQVLASLGSQCAVTPVANPIGTLPALQVGVPYTFTIETSPSQVTLAITSGTTQIFPTTKNEFNLQISNLNSLIYLYHSIGFMAAGCSAQFTIKAPQALIETALPTGAAT